MGWPSAGFDHLPLANLHLKVYALFKCSRCFSYLLHVSYTTKKLTESETSHTPLAQPSLLTCQAWQKQILPDAVIARAKGPWQSRFCFLKRERLRGLPRHSLRSFLAMTEEEARLPCRYAPCTAAFYSGTTKDREQVSCPRS